MNARSENLIEIRKKLLSSLGEKKALLYFEFFRKWARGEITISQFHRDVGNLTNSEQLRMHHRFVREFGKSSVPSYESKLTYRNDSSPSERSYSRSSWADDSMFDDYGRMEANARLKKLNWCDDDILDLINKAVKIYIQNIVRSVIETYSQVAPEYTDDSESDDKSESSDEGYEDESEASCMDYTEFPNTTKYPTQEAVHLEFGKLQEDLETIKEEPITIKEEVKSEIKDEPMEEITLYAMKEEDDVKIEDVEVKVKQEPIQLVEQLKEKKEDELYYEEQKQILKFLNLKELDEVEKLGNWERRITAKHFYIALKNNPDWIVNRCIYNTIIAKMEMLFL